MSAKELAERERYGIESLSETFCMQKWYALLALRTVCFHLGLVELHAEINVLLKDSLEVPK